ncbi:MAG: polymer-forming cytoskeletal protein [Gammaproteobacteria bacterium]|nr:polymer-forming cytoskeletal protein [Gammaproteobacteria bacterium]
MTMTIPAGTTFKGELYSKGRIKVDGNMEGHGHIDGVLWLADGSRWKGTITADVVVIAGTVEGEVVARSKLEVLPPARIIGRLTSPSIVILAGARVTGQLHMRLPEALTYRGNDAATIEDAPTTEVEAIPA